MDQITYNEALEASTKYFNGNELSARVFVDKYALTDNDGNLKERTPTDMHWRLANEFARIEAKKFKKPFTKEEIFGFLDQFEKIIPQGSPMSGIGNPYQIVSISNCFTIESPADSYGGILRADEELAQISKRRGGCGLDIANLRPAGAITHNAAKTSTGTIPFCSRFSNTIREVGQSGRRGALMITQDIHHPESVILWDEDVDGPPKTVEVKTKDFSFSTSSIYYNPDKPDFCTMKYDPSRVTGANVSFRLSDEFLNAAITEKTIYQQRWPVTEKNNPKIQKNVDATKVWDKIVRSSWQCGEPGILFWDNIIRESVGDCYSKYGFNSCSTNPCSELILPKYDSCRLLLLNLFGFVKNPFTKNAYFDYKEFYEYAKIAQRLMDDMVDMEEECVIKILEKIDSDPEDNGLKLREKELWQKILHTCVTGRRTGTGITALGDTIAACNIGYGSEEGIAMTDKIYKTLKFGCYRSSVDMAKEIGTFKIWEHELEKNNPFLNRIKDECVELTQGDLVCETIEGKTIWNDMKKNGRRNIALLTTAPAGSVSTITKLVESFGTSSGIEPQFDIKPYIRKKKGNPGDNNFRSDSKDQNGDHWMHFIIHSPSLKDWMKVTGKDDYKESPWYGHCANNLDWKTRVRLQATAQKHVDHAISSTCNLPNDVSVEKVKEIYETAWRYGCKGITVYRDGCRTGVLVRDVKNKPNGIIKTDAPKRPEKLLCDVHHIKVKGEEYFVLVGLFPDSKDPYEVFAGKNGMIKKDIHSGEIVKKARGKYDAVFEDGSVVHNISEYIGDEEEAVTRMASTCLRHGTAIVYVVNQLEKTRGHLLGFSKAMSRALKKYINEGTTVKGEECPICKSNLIRREGCLACDACGWSKCN